MKRETVVFLASGGLDSTVGMAKVMEEYQIYIYPLYVLRGAKAQTKELTSLSKILPLLAQRWHRIAQLELVNVPCPPPEWKFSYPSDMVDKLGYPMRDLILQAIGVQYAEYLNAVKGVGIRTVLVGWTADEVLPHSSELALRFANFLAQIDRDNEEWAIRSPFLSPKSMTKTEAIKWGIDHGVPIDLTWSCFHGDQSPCNQCQACVQRLKAEAQLGL